jgi:UDP-glucose 4-epimerase
MKTILVTGGLGYIGSHTLLLLIEAGFTPIIVDSLVNTDKSVLKTISEMTGTEPDFYKVDVSDTDELQKIFEQHSIDAVIHFAAYKAVGESVSNPLKYYSNNIVGLISLLSVMKQNNVRDIVFSSSCVVYGNPTASPVNEDTPVQAPESPYGATKQMSEQILKDMAKSGDCRAIALRYFNPIGAHQSRLIGELPIGQSTILVPLLTQTVAGLRESLTVFGDDYDTEDGSCIRDFIDVNDLAMAHIDALRYLGSAKTDYEIFNIGTGKGVSVLQIINAFERTTGQKVNFRIGARRPGDVVKVWADPTKAKEILGWKALIPLEKSLETAWAWQLKLNDNQNNPK